MTIRTLLRSRAGGIVVAAAVYAAFIVAAIWIPKTPGKDGGWSPEGFLIATFGLGFVLKHLFKPSSWAAAALFTSSLIWSLAGQLTLTDPMWLQHLRISPSEFGGMSDWVALVGIGQSAVFSFVWARGTRVWTLARKLRWHHWAIGITVFVAGAVHLTRYVDKPHFAALSYAAQLCVTAFLLAINIANLHMIFLAVPPDSARAIRERFARVNWDRKIPRILAAWTVAASLLLGWVALDQVPHIPDELSYVFQAECFARGIFWGPATPNPAAFDVYLIPSENGRWFAVTPPGWPAVLALGSAIGAPWLVNPILGGLAILLAHALTRRLLGIKSAHLVALLLSISPWLLYLSASYMTHPVSLVLMLGAWLCLAKAREKAASSAALWSLLAGALIGWLALVRQLDAILLAGILGLWMLGLFGRRMPWAAIVAFGAGFIPFAAIIFPYNAAMTGEAAKFPINAYLDRLWYPGANRLGFGADVGNPTGGWGDLDPFPGHGLRDVLINTNQNLYASSYELFGWCVGSLIFAFLHLFLGKRTKLDGLMVFTIVVLLLGYHLYWFSGGPDFGARYWYLMIYPLVVLTVRGISTCAEFLRRGSAGESAPDRLGVVIAVLVFTTVAVFIPWRAVTRYQDYRGFHADYGRLLPSLPPDALVFVASARKSDFGSAFILNAPLPGERRPIFAQDLGDAENRKLIAAWPDRPAVYVTGRSMGTGPTRVEPRR